MDVSVIVPLPEMEHTIGRCIDAILSQIYHGGRIEIVLVNNDANNTFTRLAGGVPSLTLIDGIDGGIYAARNRGAEAASSELLVFTEADCVPDPYWISQHVDAIVETGASVSVGKLIPAGRTVLLSTLVDYEDTKDKWNFDSEYWKRCFGRPKNLAITRTCFDSHGPFEDVVRGGDTLLVQRIARKDGCAAITYCPGALVTQQGVDGLPGLLAKRFQDSYFMTRLRSSHSAPVGIMDRWYILLETARRYRYGPLRSILLICTVAAGLAAWKLGQVAASGYGIRRPRSVQEL